MTQGVRVDGRYIPIRYAEEEPYWDAANRGVLVMPRCKQCGHRFHPVGPVCPRCLADEVGWEEVSGRGRVSSYVVYHKAWSDWLQTQVPYAVVQVELEEGPRLTAGLVDAPVADVVVGMRVRAVYEQVTDHISLVQFAPA